MPHYEVRDVMTADPVTVTPATSIKDLAGILVKQRIGALPVLTPLAGPSAWSPRAICYGKSSSGGTRRASTRCS